MKLNYIKLNTSSLYNWFYSNEKSQGDIKSYKFKVTMMYLLIIPYWIFTLPGCYLEDSFCNKNKMNKIGLTLIGYFLIFVLSGMLLYPLSFFVALPHSKLLTIAMYSSKVWLIIGAYSIIVISKELFRNYVRDKKDRIRLIKNETSTRFEIINPVIYKTTKDSSWKTGEIEMIS